MQKISVIVPCFNEEDSILLFYKEIMKINEKFKEKKINLEIIFVDDGSYYCLFMCGFYK